MTMFDIDKTHMTTIAFYDFFETWKGETRSIICTFIPTGSILEMVSRFIDSG